MEILFLQPIILSMKHFNPFALTMGLKWVALSLSLLLFNTVAQGKADPTHVPTSRTEISVSGRVTDATTQEPLIGSTVVLKGTGQGTTTDLSA